jgi:SPP1 gp7 family putative phage head morphogenesis protein
LLSELRSVLAAAYAEVQDTAIQGALDLAEYEAGFQARLLDDAATASFAVPALEQIAAAVETDLMDVEPGRAMTIRQALKEYGDKKAAEIVQAISDGIVTQQTNAEIAQAVQALGVRHRGQADSLVRTIATAAANNAKRRVYAENADLLQGERFLATLDSRTSQECMGNSDKVFPVGEGPMPPLHYRCRSVRTPLVRDDLQIPGLEGERPSVGADGPDVTSARTTMNSWLNRQPADFQRAFFAKFPDGEEKYALWKRGGLNAQKFVDDSGAALSLDELRALEPLAFERAGL